MDDIDKLSIERACERLVTAYCHYVDHGEAARIAELFTENGVWAGPGSKMSGRAQLEAGFGQRQAQNERMSRHVCNNFLCDVEDENNATGVVYLTLYRHDGAEDRKLSPLEGPELVGEYRDRFVRTPDGWRIADRRIHVSFMRGAA
jgi:hypothetical protein